MRWPLRTTYFWEEAPFFRPLLFLVIGIIGYDCGWVDKNHLTLATFLFTGAGLFVAISAFVRNRTVLLNVLYPVCFGVFFTTLGWCAYATATPGNTNNYGRGAESLSLVRIKEEPKKGLASTKLTVDLLSEVQGGAATPASGAAQINIYHNAGNFLPVENDTLLVPSHWQSIRNRGNPFELNTAAIQRRKGILYQEALSPGDIVVFGKSPAGNKSFISTAHEWCNRQLEAYIPDTATLGLLQAMLLGDESGFDPELRQAYSQTGVIHIVSISGSHVAVLYLVITGMLFWVRGKRGKWLKFMISLVLVWLYVLIAGGPPSALRSAMMFSVLALCTISEREGNTINTLSCTAFALLLYQPAWLFSVGFQLSFGAVLSILIFYQPIYRLWYWPVKTKIGKMAWQAVAASLAAEVLTAPLVIYYFHNFPLLFLFANLLAAVLVGICALVGGMAIIALCWIPPLARILGAVVTWLVHLFNAAMIWMQGLNVASLQRLQINTAELLMVYLVIIGASVLWLKERRGGLVVALCAACFLLAMLDYDHYLALRQELLIVYNNGKEPAVETIQGTHFFSNAGAEDGYSEKAAHIGYHAWQKDSNHQAPYFSMNARKFFVLTDSTQQAFLNSLPVDVLVLARPLRMMRIGETLRAFSPKEVVLAVRPSAYHLKRLKDSCAAQGIRLDNVAENGAYISK